MALKRPIYKGFRTCGWRIEIFLYGKEYGNSAQTENVHQTYFFLSTDGGAALLAASPSIPLRLIEGSKFKQYHPRYSGHDGCDKRKHE